MPAANITSKDLATNSRFVSIKSLREEGFCPAIAKEDMALGIRRAAWREKLVMRLMRARTPMNCRVKNARKVRNTTPKELNIC